MTNIRIASPLAPSTSGVSSITTPRKRADWRFLFPAPKKYRFENLLLLGESQAYSNAILETGIAERVTAVCPNEKQIDAAAILDGAQCSLERVASCLLDGAPVYYEVSKPSRFTIGQGLGQIRSRLGSAGLTLTGIYWVLPDFRNAKRYIPLDLPNAVEWYLNTLYVAGTPIQRLLEIGLRVFARRHSERLIPFAGSLTLTMCKDPVPRAGFAILETIPEFQGKQTHTILLTSGQDESSRLVMLPFMDSDNPTAVVKIAPRPGFNEMTQAEHTNLATLRSTMDGPMRNSIPEPRALQYCGKNLVAVQSYARGQSLWVSSGRWRLRSTRARQDFVLAANWLTRFHQTVQLKKIQWDAAAMNERLEPRLREYAAIFALTREEERLWSNVRAHAHSLYDQSLPIVWQHNDFGLWNLYRDGENLSVIDWESSAPGLPVCDLVYLASYWMFIVRRYHSPAQELQGIAELWTQAPARASHVRFLRGVIAQYLDALEIDPAFLPLLLVYTWVDRAVERVQRQRRLKNPLAADRAANRFVRYLGVLAAHADHLFENPLDAYK